MPYGFLDSVNSFEEGFHTVCVSQLYFCHRLGSRLHDFSAIGNLGYLRAVGESLPINQDGVRKESPPNNDCRVPEDKA